MDTETKPLWATTREAMGKRYGISLYPNNAALEDANFTCDLGQVSYGRQRIRINALMPFDGRDEALLHEVLHLVARQSSVKLEEGDVLVFSNLLYAFLRGFGLWQDFPWPDKDE